jgi:hypothetical protein
MKARKANEAEDTPSGEQDDAALYISPKELAERWRCSRPQVDRIARRAGFKRLLLGHGRNGLVRYLVAEVEALEASRLIQ